MKIPAPCSHVILVFLAAAGIAGCGGGGSDGGGDDGGPLNITTTAADDGVIGVAYSETVVATGGQGSKTFSISAGALPAGLALGAGGVISGTPVGPFGTASFTVSVSDSAATPATDTQALTIDIVEPLSITTAALADTAIGDDYDASLAAAGGTAPYTFSVASGNLPAGVTLSAAGLLSGTVGVSALTESFTVQVADSSTPQLTATQPYTVRVALEIATAQLADATGGLPYSDALIARGGLPPYEWSLLAGSLPAGLSGPDPATGQFSGTPDSVCATTTSSLTVQVTDSDVPAATDMRAAIDLMLLAQALGITTAALPNATIGGSYSERIFASGGVPPYTFALTGGVLPSQLALNASNGRITGTPDTVETQAFEVSVTDICPETVSRDLSIAVVGPPSPPTTRLRRRRYCRGTATTRHRSARADTRTRSSIRTRTTTRSLPRHCRPSRSTSTPRSMAVRSTPSSRFLRPTARSSTAARRQPSIRRANTTTKTRRAASSIRSSRPGFPAERRYSSTW